MENARTHAPTQLQPAAISSTPGHYRPPHSEHHQLVIEYKLAGVVVWYTITPGSGGHRPVSMLCRTVGPSVLHRSDPLESLPTCGQGSEATDSALQLQPMKVQIRRTRTGRTLLSTTANSGPDSSEQNKAGRHPLPSPRIEELRNLATNYSKPQIRG